MSYKHFHGLTAAQAERLYLIAEEASEVIQAVHKILRHGYDSHHPDGGPDNRSLLEKELGDFQSVVAFAQFKRDLVSSRIHEAARAKPAKCNKYLHHNDMLDLRWDKEIE